MGLDFRFIQSPWEKLGLKMGNSQHSFWQKVEALIPETLSWAPDMEASVRPDLRKRHGDGTRAGDRG